MPINMTGIKTVVCIEDELEMVELIKLILGRRGIELAGAPGGSEGVETIRRLKPDLVLLDTQTPGAWDVYFAMKADEELKHIPIQMTSARAHGIEQVLGRFGD
jgi:CheY-like chemotaxis protein